MPNWSPNWNRVQWNWDVASEAAGSLRRAADKLDSYAHERRQVAADAQQEWRGRYREEFDHRLQRMLAQSRDLAAQMRDAANRVDHASSRAWSEQQHRWREQERWRREKREEEERERRSRDRRD